MKILIALALAQSFGGIAYLFPRAGPDDHTWHHAKTRVNDAWLHTDARGEGVLIAQPDTGWVPHRSIPRERLDLEHQFDFTRNDANALDDLQARDGFIAVPGHCTQAQALIVGPEIGVAPASTIMPLKISSGVILTDPVPLTRAIEYATRHRADLIVIAQGTPLYDDDMHRAVRAATDAGVVVIAAAGNGTPFVVYPAAFDEVIAVAATTVDDDAFTFSSFGEAVDLSAPGAEVYTAWSARNPLSGVREDVVRATYGTTLASAQVAGALALWLSHHRARGIDPRALYGEQHARVVRDLLIKSARRPAGWRPERYGAGVLDADALIASALPPSPRSSSMMR